MRHETLLASPSRGAIHLHHPYLKPGNVRHGGRPNAQNNYVLPPWKPSLATNNVFLCIPDSFLQAIPTLSRFTAQLLCFHTLSCTYHLSLCIPGPFYKFSTTFNICSSNHPIASTRLHIHINISFSLVIKGFFEWQTSMHGSIFGV